MQKKKRSAGALVVLTVTAVLSFGSAPAAAAKSASMNIGATGGDGTSVDHDGTQGAFTDSIQGAEDGDGDQDAFDMITSEEAKPQVISPNKMTKR